uniref:Uncharacterized protein n=1 Tax=Glossina palpalis gambiensis TaxID=67801 RepID=A0A1B0BZR1_9MUSC
MTNGNLILMSFNMILYRLEGQLLGNEIRKILLHKICETFHITVMLSNVEPIGLTALGALFIHRLFIPKIFLPNTFIFASMFCNELITQSNIQVANLLEDFNEFSKKVCSGVQFVCFAHSGHVAKDSSNSSTLLIRVTCDPCSNTIAAGILVLLTCVEL